MTHTRPTRWLLVLLALAFAGATVGACSSSDDNPTTPEETEEDMNDGNDGGDVVVIRLTGSLTFEPAEVTIAPGTTVRWVNDTDFGHTVTPDGHSEWNEWLTNSDGETFEHTFSSAGDFDYFCRPHLAQGMTGKVTVQ